MFPPCRECMEIKKTGSWKMEKRTKLRIRPGGWAVLLLALGFLLYREGVTAGKLIGLALCIAGLFFLNK